MYRLDNARLAGSDLIKEGTAVRSFIAMCFGVMLLATTQATAQQQARLTAQAFLAGCGATDRATLSSTHCAFFVVGFLEGGIMAETRNKIAHRYCTRDASYGEVADAYAAFVRAEQAKGNVGIVSQDNTAVFIRFMDARYRCR